MMIENSNETHYIDIEHINKEKMFCQRQILLQYNDHKIDEEKLANKLCDLQQYCGTAEDAINQMKKLSDAP